MTLESSLEAMKFLEIESKYRADSIKLLDFKTLLDSLKPLDFLYVESTDIYFVKSEEEFLRYRMPPDYGKEKRAELTFKKKHILANNLVRTEVNLRVDSNKLDTIEAFCEGLGYNKNFSILKLCDIYSFKDAILVYYTVKGEDGSYQSFIEIEALEGYPTSKEQAKAIIRDYERLLEPLGVTAQNRLKKSLFELYRK